MIVATMFQTTRSPTSTSAAETHHYATESYRPQPPAKIIIEDHSLIETFRRSAAFQQIISYLQACCDAIESVPFSCRISTTVDDCDETTRYFVLEYFPKLHRLIDEIPLEDLAQQRFGNRAKRVFHARLEETVQADMMKLAATFPTSAARSEAEMADIAVELAAYIQDSFGNATRLDYGSGHELHFFIVLIICLMEHDDHGGSLHDQPTIFVPLQVPPPPPERPAGRQETKKRRQDYIFYIFHDYLQLVRRLQKHYSLEPAGSHGVWGLDDYHHLPYVFGAAQLVDAEQRLVNLPPAAAAKPQLILPKYICDRDQVAKWKNEYFYFSMIQWIFDNKLGPFHEHSNMLYNISGVEHWAKIYGGMVKMLAAEVLAKFNVSQHLLFGQHLPWNTASL